MKDIGMYILLMENFRINQNLSFEFWINGSKFCCNQWNMTQAQYDETLDGEEKNID